MRRGKKMTEEYHLPPGTPLGRVKVKRKIPRKSKHTFMTWDKDGAPEYPERYERFLRAYKLYKEEGKSLSSICNDYFRGKVTPSLLIYHFKKYEESLRSASTKSRRAGYIQFSLNKADGEKYDNYLAVKDLIMNHNYNRNQIAKMYNLDESLTNTLYAVLSGDQELLAYVKSPETKEELKNYISKDPANKAGYSRYLHARELVSFGIGEEELAEELNLPLEKLKRFKEVAKIYDELWPYKEEVEEVEFPISADPADEEKYERYVMVKEIIIKMGFPVNQVAHMLGLGKTQGLELYKLLKKDKDMVAVLGSDAIHNPDNHLFSKDQTLGIPYFRYSVALQMASEGYDMKELADELELPLERVKKDKLVQEVYENNYPYLDYPFLA